MHITAELLNLSILPITNLDRAIIKRGTVPDLFTQFLFDLLTLNVIIISELISCHCVYDSHTVAFFGLMNPVYFSKAVLLHGKSKGTYYLFFCINFNSLSIELTKLLCMPIHSQNSILNTVQLVRFSTAACVGLLALNTE